MEFLLVGIGGALGSILRYITSNWTLNLYSSTTFPSGTFLVNILGCAAIGIFSAAVQRYGLGDPRLKLLVVTGFLGGFTTFSAFGVETAELIRSGNTSMALFYSLSSILAGVLAVFVGYKVL